MALTRLAQGMQGRSKRTSFYYPCMYYPSEYTASLEADLGQCLLLFVEDIPGWSSCPQETSSLERSIHKGVHFYGNRELQLAYLT